jgi:hypothetical protein
LWNGEISAIHFSIAGVRGRSVARRQEHAAVTLETQCDTGTVFYLDSL